MPPRHVPLVGAQAASLAHDCEVLPEHTPNSLYVYTWLQVAGSHTPGAHSAEPVQGFVGSFEHVWSLGGAGTAGGTAGETLALLTLQEFGEAGD